jgi:hypothetical protein
MESAPTVWLERCVWAKALRKERIDTESIAIWLGEGRREKWWQRSRIIGLKFHSWTLEKGAFTV